MKESYLIVKIGFPLLLALLAGLIAFGCNTDTGSGLTIAFGVFSVTTVIVDVYIFQSRQNEIEEKKKDIHKEYAIEDTRKISALLNKRNNVISIIYSLDALEDKLMQIYKCCSDGEGKEIDTYKGNFGNFRVQLMKSNPDIEPIYIEIAQEINSLQHFLQKM